MKRLLPAVSALSLVASAQAETLHLVCVGGGAANKADLEQVFWGNSNGQSAWANVARSRPGSSPKR